MSDVKTDPSHAPRRSFVKEAMAIVLGGLATLVPVGAGIAVFFDPLRKKKGATSEGAIRVATLSALPEDGVPRKFAVIADKSDAWNKYPQVPIGAVYLVRKGEEVTALNVVCPHAGCFVDFNVEKKCYLCPCHNSTFGLNGEINDPKSPSPRGMDSLTTEVRGNDVFVHFKNFRAGTHERIPEA